MSYKIEFDSLGELRRKYKEIMSNNDKAREKAKNCLFDNGVDFSEMEDGSLLVDVFTITERVTREVLSILESPLSNFKK